MTFLEALLIGIIQGLTEFLPVSSTAHIRIIPALLGWEDPGAAFTAVIQCGTLVAALLYFRADIVRLVTATWSALRSGKFCPTLDAKMAWMIVLGTVPVVIFGLLLKKHIETSLRSLYVISGSLMILALVLLAAEAVVAWRQRHRAPQKQLKDLSWGDAIGVGLAQAVALIPGASRSGVTITGGLFLGMTRETAARFSFLLSLPAVFAAGVYELYKERHELLASQDSILYLLTATIVSGFVGYATIAFLLGYLKKHTTYLFILYRLGLGSVLLVLLSIGLLQALPSAGEDLHAGPVVQEQTASALSMSPQAGK